MRSGAGASAAGVRSDLEEAVHERGLGHLRTPVLDLEEVEELRPEVVLLPDEPYPFSAEDLEEFYALDVPAAREDRIHLVDGKLLTWYGPRMASSITQLAALLRR